MLFEEMSEEFDKLYDLEDYDESVIEEIEEKCGISIDTYEKIKEFDKKETVWMVCKIKKDNVRTIADSLYNAMFDCQSPENKEEELFEEELKKVMTVTKLKELLKNDLCNSWIKVFKGYYIEFL